jgi:hypothetical protein
MPAMRNQAVRKEMKTTFKRPISRLHSTSDAEKIRMFRTLYVMLYNGEESIIPLATELFHTIGEILEGVSAEELDLVRIDKSVFLDELREP